MASNKFGGAYATHAPTKLYWSNFDSAPSNVPLFADSMWVGAWPKNTDLMPKNLYWGPDPLDFGKLQDELQYFCIDRHNLTINMTFKDTRVDKVPLEKLWTLPWYKGCGPKFNNIVLPKKRTK
jgi:hypothetical protein